MQKLEQLLEWGGTKRDIAFLILSGLALLLSIFHLNPFPFDMAWVAIILCGVPIILEAVIGLVTAFDIKADVLVSIALVASVLIGEDFAAGEVAFIMQLGGLLEDLTVARARRHRKAGPSDPAHRPPDSGRTGTNPPRRAGTGRGHPAGAAGRDRPGGRRHPLRTDLDQPGGHDRGVAAGR